MPRFYWCLAGYSLEPVQFAPSSEHQSDQVEMCDNQYAEYHPKFRRNWYAHNHTLPRAL